MQMEFKVPDFSFGQNGAGSVSVLSGGETELASVDVSPYAFPQGDSPASSQVHASLCKAVIAVMRDVPYIQRVETAGLRYKILTEELVIRYIRSACIRHGITITPKSQRVLKEETYQSGSGTPWRRVAIEAEFTLSHADSDDVEVISSIGEGADPGDKAIPKALTIALKYALRQKFLISTGDDPDYTPSEPAASPSKKQETDKPKQSKLDPVIEKFSAVMDSLKKAGDVSRLNILREAFQRRCKDLPAHFKKMMEDYHSLRLSEIRNASQDEQAGSQASPESDQKPKDQQASTPANHQMNGTSIPMEI